MRLIGSTYKSPWRRILVFNDDRYGVVWFTVTFNERTGIAEDIEYDRECKGIRMMIDDLGEDRFLETLKRLVRQYDVSWFMTCKILIEDVEKRMDDKDAVYNFMKDVVNKFKKHFG